MRRHAAFPFNMLIVLQYARLPQIQTVFPLCAGSFFCLVCNYNFAAHRRHGSGRGFGVRGGQDGTEDACEKGKEDYRDKKNDKNDKKDELKEKKDVTKDNKEDERRRGS